MTSKTRDISQSISLNQWFIRLRWIASVVSLILVVITVKIFHYLPDNNFWSLLYLIFILAFTNIVYTYFIKKNIFTKHLKELQIVADLLILTFMLHYSGGIENPLSFVFLFHVILSGILLEKKKSYMVVAFAFLLYFSMAMTELTKVVPHYTLNIFPHTDSEQDIHPEGESDDHQITEHEAIHASHYPPYVWSITVLNLFMMLLTAFFITNIMERLRSEERKTEEERQRLDHVLHATNAGLVILDKNLEIVWYNEPIKSLLSLNSVDDSLLPMKILDWIDVKEGPASNTIKDGIIRSVEREKVDNNGQRQYFQVTIAPLTNDKGEVYQVVELIQDISQKKILEAEMLHTAKMVTLGTMAAGIAHEVGNPLASISTRLNLLETENDPSFISQSVKLLQREISRIDRIVRGISQFGRSPKEEWGICKVNQVLKETIEMLKYHKAARACVIVSKLSSNLPDILGVSDQLKQVFLNIGLNAFEAMPEGGTLTITSIVEEGNLKFKFTDNGEGIKKEELERILQPFFTTKQKGSGLGLFIVNHFVQAHSGYLEVNSEYGKGTTITVTLPVHLPHQLRKVNKKMS